MCNHLSPGQTANSVCGWGWIKLLLMSTLWIEWPMDEVAYGGGGVMVWAGVCYGHQTQVPLLMAFEGTEIP